MKTKLLAIGLVVAGLALLQAAPDTPKMNLTGVALTSDGHTSTIKGSAVATFGDLRVSSDQILFNQDTGVLTCPGEATIETPSVTMKVTNATIDPKGIKPAVSAEKVTILR